MSTERTNLDGQWKLARIAPMDRPPLTLEDLDKASQRGEVRWIGATVPGNVELDLVDAGELPDPFYADNVKKLKALELCDWWYEKTFTTPAGFETSARPIGVRAELVFNGVDCFATYWLNGKRLGCTDNMLIEHTFDVTDHLVPQGANRLVVRLASAVGAAHRRPYSPSLTAGATNWEHLWVRKAPHSYGWDIMPRIPSAGLWRSVELDVHEGPRIRDTYLYTQALAGTEAQIGLYYELEGEPGDAEGLELACRGRCGFSEFSTTIPVLFKAGRAKLHVPDAKPWWPGDYGEATLYTVRFELRKDGRVLDSADQTFGIRTVTLRRTELTTREKPGEFLFEVNGCPIFCKGSNWVPVDAFHSRDSQRYARIIDLFKDTGCNMVRCWGGNVYEDHAFFDLCDENGIMVWQDFAMACAAYPQEEAFYRNIKAEVESTVRKLRQHPSLVVWSGDNECDQIALGQGLDPWKNRITRELLPQAVYRCDPFRPYLPSSPYMAREVVETGDTNLMPEQHLWGPRNYFKSPFYSRNTAHFISEIGYHGCPGRSSLERFLDTEHLWPWQDNEQWLTHATESVGPQGRYAYRNKLMADQIRELFGVDPTDLDTFILASQISQAEAKKFFIEMTRTKKWRKTGILWWNMIDGWPQFSDAVVDYYFNKKLAYNYIKRSQQTVCLMVDEPEGWDAPLVASNDSRAPATGSFFVRDAETDRTVLEGEFIANPDRNVQLGSLRFSHGEHKLYLIEWRVGNTKGGNHYLAGHPPFSLDRYRSEWLPEISALTPTFDASSIGR